MVRMSNPHPEAPRVSCLPRFAYERALVEAGPDSTHGGHFRALSGL